MRIPVLAALACLLSPMIVMADAPQLKLPSFTHLQSQATEVVDMTIGAWPLGLVSRLMSSDTPDDAAAKRIIAGLKSVIVRSYEFDKDFVYSRGDVAAIRSQLVAPQWSRLAQVRSRTDNEDVDIYVAMDQNRISGLAIIATDPRQFTIVNIVGEVQLDQLPALQSQLHLPAGDFALADMSASP